MSTFIEFADPIAGITVQAMLNSIWQGALITAIVFGLVKLLRRTNAATRYVMWLVTLTAVFCLFLLNAWNAGGGYDLLNLVKFNESMHEPAAEINPDLQQPAQVISSSEKQEETAVPEAENSESLLMTGSEMTSEGAASNNYQIHLAPGMWHIFVFCAWFLIALFLLLRLIHSYFYSLHLKRSARQLPGKHQEMLGSWIYAQKIKRTIRICSSEQVTTPVAIGLFNPVVLIPESLLNKLSEAELKQVIAHELAHLQRRDDWTNLLQKIIEAFLFFHPAVWLLKIRLNLDREIACDDSVVATSGENRQYIECLVRLVELVSFSPKPVLASGALQTKKQIFKRIEALMQTNRKFKIGISIIGICAVIVLIVVGIYQFTKMQPLVSLEDEQEILTNVLTFEFSFGDEKTITKDEFLLAKPTGIIVPDNGDIIVSDESRLKVYDCYGEPKRIIGGPGQGPGEFGGHTRPFITDTGYILGVVERSYIAYNLFAPDYTFVERKNLLYGGLREKILEKNNWLLRSFGVFHAAYAYSPEELLVIVSGNENKEGKPGDPIYAIVFQSDEDVRTIYEAKYPVEKLNIDIERGDFQYGLLRDRKVVYTFAREHKTFENGEWFYSLFIYDLKTHEKTEIKKAYTPVAIPDSIIYRPLDVPDGFPEDLLNQAKEKEKERSKKLEELKMYPAVKNILTDGEFIFVFTFEYDKEKGQLVDIFNSTTGKYIHSAYFPRWVSILTISDYSCIKNGRIYRMKAPFDEFPVVEKYKIDPAVYGK